MIQLYFGRVGLGGASFELCACDQHGEVLKQERQRSFGFSADQRIKDIDMRRFFFIFLALQILLFGIELLQPVQQHLVLPWTALLAKTCVALVAQFDLNAVAFGKILWNPATRFGVSIEPGCNGVEACIVLLAAIVAFPAGWRHRAWGLAFGFLAVQGLNVVRIISLFYLGQWNESVFRFAHEYLWQGLIMLDVLLVWLFWIKANPDPWVRSDAHIVPNQANSPFGA